MAVGSKTRSFCFTSTLLFRLNCSSFMANATSSAYNSAERVFATFALSTCPLPPGISVFRASLVFVNGLAQGQRKGPGCGSDAQHRFVGIVNMPMPGEHRHAEQIARSPIVAHAVDDAVAPALEEIDDRFHGVPVSEGAPILPLLGVRRNYVVPQPMGMIVGAQARINDVNVLVLAQLLFDLRPFEQHLLLFATALLLLCKTHAVHAQFTVNFLDRSLLHDSLLVANFFLQIWIPKQLRRLYYMSGFFPRNWKTRIQTPEC